MNENLEVLIAALRSGEYEQGTGHLLDGRKYCCLGVAEMCREGDAEAIYGKSLPDFYPLATWLGFEVEEIAMAWNPSVNIPAMTEVEAYELLGIDEDTDLSFDCEQSIAGIVRGEGAQLANLNDDIQLSFLEIADLLEKYGLKEPNANQLAELEQ